MTLSATQLFLVSFAGLIAVGTLGLLVLPGLYTGPGLSFVDALFTATSAVCVTGLIVVDTATYFTPAGQAWILLLIQLGALGILTFTTAFIVLLGQRATLGAEQAAAGESAVVRNISPTGLVKAVVISTFVLEAAGAVSLWAAWREGMGDLGAVWPAVFQAVSAFCNAGFSTFSDSLSGFRGQPFPLLVVSALIVAGGVGFVVLADLWVRHVDRGARRLGTHTRVVLLATAALLAGGTVLFFLFEGTGVEGRGTLAGLDRVDQLVNAWFMSVTPRTAGFNTVSYDAVTNPSLFLTILLMIVGGSPGSAAGGLKTTTVALLAMLLWSRLRGRQHVSLLGRTIPEETLQRAAGLTLGGLVILAGAVFLLSLTEAGIVGGGDRIGFLRLVFEAHSAFGTVGLSMGATPDLSSFGRLVVVGLMFVGRVGPLAVVSSMAAAGARPSYRYAYEDVAIG